MQKARAVARAKDRWQLLYALTLGPLADSAFRALNLRQFDDLLAVRRPSLVTKWALRRTRWLSNLSAVRELADGALRASQLWWLDNLSAVRRTADHANRASLDDLLAERELATSAWWAASLWWALT